MDKLKTFNHIYNSYYRKCFLFARSYVHNAEIADDLASESMVKLWEQFDEVENIQSIQAFLFTIVRNLSINHLKREQLKLQVHDNILNVTLRELEFRISTLESCDPQVLFSSELRTLYEETLASMSDQTRSVFEMSRIEEMPNKEIATILGISVKGVDYHISKALKLLRIKLKDYLPAFLIFI